MTLCAIDVIGVSKQYGEVAALDDISLQIYHNEFFTLLGPSGCGKTTMLRIIAGFEEVSGGEVFLFGEDIKNRPPHRRPINTVFQSYALFPHISVMDNVMFGLRMLKKPPAESARRAAQMLAMVKLSEFADKRPAQLSGGQRQRVALARALAPAPRVLLLDESLSALDLKLRQAMRVELKQIQRDTGITFVFVTHDQDEALTMSDRIAVMSRGKVQQVGVPRDIYEAPCNRFVADFIGDVNLLSGSIQTVGDRAFCLLAGGHRVAVEAADVADAADTADTAAQQHIAVRPEKAQLTTAADGLPGVVERSTYIGATTETVVRLAQGGPSFMVRTQNTSAQTPPPPGAQVGIRILPGAARLLKD